MTPADAERLFSAGPPGVAEWNQRREAGEAIPDLREADLWGKDLPGINLSGAQLLGACLVEATLTGADFRQASLYGANFAGAKLSGASFVGADLRHARFGVFSIGLGHSSACADLRGADFSGARLSDADLSESVVAGARFCGADLTRADLRYSQFADADLGGAILVDVRRDQSPSPAPAMPVGPPARPTRARVAPTPPGTRARHVVGVLTVAYGVLLSLFWGAILVSSVVGGKFGPGVVALGFGAVAGLLVLTGLTLRRAAPRPLAFTTAALLVGKAGVAGIAAADSLGATGEYRSMSHAVGWVVLAVVVVPSLAWALALVAAVTAWAAPPAEAADYDDAATAEPGAKPGRRGR